MLVDYGIYGRGLADHIRRTMPKEYRLRLRAMKDDDVPSTLCKLMMTTYQRAYPDSKFQTQFNNFAMTSKHTYGTYLSDLLIEFDQAEPELSDNWQARSVEKIVLQYYNGMIPGKNNEMKEYFKTKFLGDLDALGEWSREYLEERIQNCMVKYETVQSELKPVTKPSRSRKENVSRVASDNNNGNESSSDDDGISTQTSESVSNMSDYLEIDQWNPPSEHVCQVRADDACRNCGELGH